jgi:carboxyl-terminal processing protease
VEGIYHRNHFRNPFFAFKAFDKKAPELPEIRHRKLLSTIGHLLETEHYSPRKIDDEFSKDVFKAFIKALDPENIFLQTDINALSAYETTLDCMKYMERILNLSLLRMLYMKKG